MSQQSGDNEAECISNVIRAFLASCIYAPLSMALHDARLNDWDNGEVNKVVCDDLKH